MSSSLGRQESSSITYEQLYKLEQDFDNVETELLRKSYEFTKVLYRRRQGLVSQIPNFWSTALEQFSFLVDEHINPMDSLLLPGCLSSISVDRFELPAGDPRSISIRFEFSPNEFLHDTVLEKKFWWRSAPSGWAGLVSEPVNIRWKHGKDLTNGTLALACRAWQDEMAGRRRSEIRTAVDSLKREAKHGGESFFEWFGYRGPRAAALRIPSNQTHPRGQTAAPSSSAARNGQDDNHGNDDDDQYDLFPDGDDMAIAIADDLWPGAIRYFLQAHEQDTPSASDFESDDERPPQKRHKA